MKHPLTLFVFVFISLFLSPISINAFDCYPNPDIDPSQQESYFNCFNNPDNRMFCPEESDGTDNMFCCIKMYNDDPAEQICPGALPSIDPTNPGQWKMPCGLNNSCATKMICTLVQSTDPSLDGQMRCCAIKDKTCDIDPNNPTSIGVFNICEGSTGDEKRACEDCLGKNGTQDHIWTALGCISSDPVDFLSDFLKIALGIAGGIALLLMIYGSFLISTSAGDPKKAEEGKEIITGTIAGLIFIIFSAFLLKLIGVDILQIPGF